MPFKSEAQRAKWQQLLAEGKISQDAYDTRTQETGDAPLPPRTIPRRRTVGPSRSAAEAKIGNGRY